MGHKQCWVHSWWLEREVGDQQPTAGTIVAPGPELVDSWPRTLQ